MAITKAKCALCFVIIDSSNGFERCECGTIAVDDGRVLAVDLAYAIKVSE
jgi:hypothetical protein